VDLSSSISVASGACLVCVCVYIYESFTTGDDWTFKNVLYELSYDIKIISFHNFSCLFRLFQ
jgi:hypothetical protein